MKKEIILENLIKTYLSELSPISSGELKRKCDLPFSPSTIRNYLQKLDGEGMIVKIHISSGSIPSKEALKKYWYENLKFNDIKISKDKLDKVAKNFDVFISIKQKEALTLKSIINVENRFIILDFEKEEIILRFSNEMFHFFQQFINYSLKDIQKALKLIKLDNIVNKFSINKYENFNREFLYKHYKEFEIDDLLSDKIFDKFKNGLSFKNDFLAYKIENKNIEFIVIGDIYNDYLKLFDSIKEAS